MLYPHKVGGIYLGEIMKNKYLEVGKAVGTHGVKGMLRVQVWADSVDFLKQFKYI